MIKFCYTSRKTRTFLEKCLYCLLAEVVRSSYAKLAHLDFINKKIIELVFKLNIPFSFSGILRGCSSHLNEG